MYVLVCDSPGVIVAGNPNDTASCPSGQMQWVDSLLFVNQNSFLSSRIEASDLGDLLAAITLLFCVAFTIKVIRKAF